MTEAEALRVLGLDGVGPIAIGLNATSTDTPEADVSIDAETVRDAFGAQMYMLREARTDARSARERQRIDRAMALTRMARDRLLPAESPDHAVTEELARIERPQMTWHGLAALVIGVLLVLIGLLAELDWAPIGVVDAPDVAALPAAEVAQPPVSRALLDSVRLALQARWQETASSSLTEWLPGDTDLSGLTLPLLPAGWYWQGQRDGAFAAVDSAGQDWVLAAPLLEDDSLYWACFSARPGRSGCHVLAGDTILERRLPRGQVGARLLADALARLPPSQRQDGWSPQRWYGQALRQMSL